MFDNLHKKALFLRSKIGDSIYIWNNNILIRDMYLTTEKKQEFFKTFEPRLFSQKELGHASQPQLMDEEVFPKMRWNIHRMRPRER